MILKSLHKIFAGKSNALATVSGNLEHLWIYILAPIIGAVLASVTWNVMKSK